jgi:Ras-related protein Rab-21
MVKYIIILGRVGKTSILNKYINNKFTENQDMTINSCYLEKEIEYNGEKITYCIWVRLTLIQDTAGQEKFNALTPIYYRDAKAAILVYDVTISDTFKRVQKWAAELRTFNSETIMAIAGNKIDLNKIDIAKEVVEEYAEIINSKHFYTSAKTGEGLEDIFKYITQELIKLPSMKKRVNTKRIQVKKQPIGLNKEKSKKKCC